MALEMRPLTLGDILDRAFRLYRENFILWLSVVAVFLLPEAVIAAPFEIEWAERVHEPIAVLQQRATLFPLQIAIWAVAQGALALAVAERYLDRRVTLGAVVSATVRRIPHILVATFLTIILFTIGFVALIVPGIYIWLGLLLAPTVIVIEKSGPLAGMGRAWRLARGERRRLLNVVFTAGLMAFVGGFLVSTVVGLVAPASIASALGQRVGQLLTLPFSEAAVVIAYFDLRVRKEAFDLEMMASALGGGGGT